MSRKFIQTLLATIASFIFVSGFARPVNDFTKLVITGNVTVTISQNDDKFTIRGAGEDAEDGIEAEVQNNTLTITQHVGVGDGDKKISFYTTELVEIEVSGNSKLITQGMLHFTNIKITMDGNADQPLNLEADRAVFKIKANNDLSIIGSANTADFFVSGNSNVDGKGFLVQSASVNCSSNNEVWVNVKKSLRANVSGNATLYYKSYLISKKPKKYAPLISRKLAQNGSIKAY
jgi:Putative auto-transporter adhesin, head GIN domain